MTVHSDIQLVEVKVECIVEKKFWISLSFSQCNLLNSSILHNTYPIKKKLTGEIVVQHIELLIVYHMIVSRNLDNLDSDTNFFLCGRIGK